MTLLLLVLLISSCSSPILASPTITPLPTETSTPTPTPTEIPVVAAQREVVTLADVKNVNPSLLIGSGEAKVTNYPPNSTDIMKSEIDDRFNAVLHRFGADVTVYFDQDTTPDGSANWVLYATKLGSNGKRVLIHQISSYPVIPGQSAPDQPSDYPIQFLRNEKTGILEVVGDYTVFDIPGEEVGVIWIGLTLDKRLPQFLANEVSVGPDRYYIEALDYKSFIKAANAKIWTDVAGVADIVDAAVGGLSTQELAAKNLYGSGFELKTEFQGIPVDLTVVTSKATLTQYKQTRGCMPNQEMVKYGASAEDRMAEMFFWGHYIGYLRDKGLTESGYPFETYIADLNAGKDRGYTIWGPRLDGSDGEFRVNPLSLVEYVTTNAVVDPDGNGRGTALLTDNIDKLGYQQLENGGLRIVQELSYTYKDYPTFCSYSSDGFNNSLLSLGVPRMDFLQGHVQLIPPGNFPITQARLNTIYTDVQIYKDSDGLLGPGVLVP
jgi:hypothetical protein